MLTCGPRLAKIIPRLASDQPGEVAATVAAIRRTLSAAGLDLNDLAAELMHPAPASIPHHARRPRRERTPRTAPISAEALRLLRAALQLDILSQWEVGFANSIIEAAQRPTWRPSPRQREVLAKLTERAQEAEQHL